MKDGWREDEGASGLERGGLKHVEVAMVTSGYRSFSLSA